ncbi:MAG TPA: patatin-like phospholipase family protein [Chromatiales bacterium]|nr:patatin-like phospholipase family protein [Chromatiales bacterium]
MTGGGARAAYQVGVLRAIADLTPRKSASPFRIICGTSAGAINAAALATHAHNFRIAVYRLHNIWSNFRVDQVFRADAAGIAKTGANWLLTMMSAGLLGKRDALYLLDRTPLKELLRRYFNPADITSAIERGHLYALSVTASGYASHQSVSFYQGHGSLQSWSRSRRVGARAEIGIEHLLASSAIPFLFAPVKVNREFFGDGTMRQIAPISPALHLGASRVLVIGNRSPDDETHRRISEHEFPSFGEIAGHTLNSIFLDSLEADIERLMRINKTIRLIPPETRQQHGIELRHVDVLVIAPSQDLGDLAHRYVKELPRALRLLLRGIGATRPSGSSLMSYLLFEKGYCRKLIELGYEDARARTDELRELLGL